MHLDVALGRVGHLCQGVLPVRFGARGVVLACDFFEHRVGLDQFCHQRLLLQANGVGLPHRIGHRHGNLRCVEGSDFIFQGLQRQAVAALLCSLPGGSGCRFDGPALIGRGNPRAQLIDIVDMRQMQQRQQRPLRVHQALMGGIGLCVEAPEFRLQPVGLLLVLQRLGQSGHEFGDRCCSTLPLKLRRDSSDDHRRVVPEIAQVALHRFDAILPFLTNAPQLVVDLRHGRQRTLCRRDRGGVCQPDVDQRPAPVGRPGIELRLRHIGFFPLPDEQGRGLLALPGEFLSPGTGGGGLVDGI